MFLVCKYIKIIFLIIFKKYVSHYNIKIRKIKLFLNKKNSNFIETPVQIQPQIIFKQKIICLKIRSLL
jgi:hypothetical protein